MGRSSLHLFIALYLCPYTCFHSTKAAENGTIMTSLPSTTKSLSVTDELLESLIRRIADQEIRLQRLETTLSENVEALKSKDRLIKDLMRRVGSIEFKTRLDEFETILSAPNPTADQRTPSETTAFQLRASATAIDETQNPGVKRKSTVNPQTAHHQPQADGDAVPRIWSNRVGPVEPYGNVAFSVKLSNDTTLNAHETIIYNHVITDNTNMYNTRTGIFSVPISGVYVFTWACSSGYNLNGFVHTSLRIDGVSRCVTYADSPANGDIDSTTGLIVTAVNQGVSVYVRAETSGTVMNNEYAVATFSGWRLF